jgi:shikimate dehydrogenase
VRGFAGLNITHPFKQSVIPHLDVLSPESTAIGAVNTIVFEHDRTVGHNTDCWGFAESFRSEMHGADLDRVLLLGAGGAGRAVAHALRELGAGEIEIFDLDPQPAIDLAAILNAEGALRASVTHDVAAAAASAGGIVNTTPVGMAKYPGMPVPVSALRPDLWVVDVIYFPAETELLGSALAAGSRTMSGRGMAVFQAVRAFELLTGRRPDVGSMFRHFDSVPQNARLAGID